MPCIMIHLRHLESMTRILKVKFIYIFTAILLQEFRAKCWEIWQKIWSNDYMSDNGRNKASDKTSRWCASYCTYAYIHEW